MFKDSEFQINIFDKFKNDTCHIAINAVAGSGKTTTILRALDLIPINPSTGRRFPTIFLAFNKSIVKELQSRCPSDVYVKTLHGQGWKEVRFRFGDNVKKDEQKISKIISTMVAGWEMDEDPASYAGRVERIVDVMRFALPQSKEELLDLCERHEILITGNEIEHAKQVLLAARKDTKTFDFVDMIYFPAADWNSTFKCQKFKYVFVDECQDLNPMQHALVRKLVDPDGGRLVMVGDPCQPSDTLVDVVIKNGNRWSPAILEKRKISKLKIGDMVVSMSRRDGIFLMTGRRVNGITAKPYSGKLINVFTETGLKSAYTPNHHCLVNLSDLRNQYCVYLMQKGEYFRIGSSKMDYGNNVGSGPSARMRAENADAMWILKTYPSKLDARIAEKSIAGKFGIPELIFQESLSPLVKEAWEFIGNNTDRGILCLEYFNRNIKYPLHSKFNPLNKNYCTKRPMIMYACNILNGAKLLPFNNKTHFKSSEWLSVKVSYTEYNDLVYSLDVEKDHLYVADGLVTHNCQSIYGFSGADINSFDKMKTIFPNTVELPLSFSYRCGHSIIKHAQELVPHILPAPNAPDGIVRAGSFGEVADGDFVLCRNTKPLVSLCLKYIAEGKKATIKGGDIGANLINMIKKTKAKTHRAMFNKLDADLGKLAKKLREQNPYKDVEKLSSYVTMSDKIDALHAISNTCKSDRCEEIADVIGRIFADDTKSGIVLSTMHKSKGLEADNVFIIEPHLIPAVYATKDWAIKQEENLEYVARTRAKKQLVYVDDYCSDDRISNVKNAVECKLKLINA